MRAFDAAKGTPLPLVLEGLGGRVAGSSSQKENHGEEESPDWPQ